MALAGIKLEDDKAPFVRNCFPVRSSLSRFNNEASGKWLEVQQDEQRRRLKALLTSKPLTYARIKEERKKAEKQGSKLEIHALESDSEEENNGEKILDGFFLMKHCCVDDPSDLCSINILNQELTDVKEEDLAMFDNVAYINAGENYLPLEAFRGFPSLRELELPLNGVRSLHISSTDFIHLEILDLSYNNLSREDLMTLGLLSNLKVLHLTGNNFVNLPADLALPHVSKEKYLNVKRFSNLEVLLLDDNKLKDISLFAALAGLPRLVHLDLSKNEIFFVPQLKSVEGKLVTHDSLARQKSDQQTEGQKSSRGSKKSSRAETKSGSSKTSAGNKLSQNLEESEQTATKVTKESTFQDLMTDDFGAADLLTKIEELGLETENSNVSSLNKTLELQRPPFPELRYLNLAHNKISEEEGLLALAAWPTLAEVDIYNNPLTTETSGDPPLLKRFLQERLHIKLNRKKPQEMQVHTNKTRGKIHPKNIKITDHVPKVPKVSLETKMLLSAAICESIPSNSLGKAILPPIPAETKEEVDRNIDDDQAKEKDGEASETFFMTQLDDMDSHAEEAVNAKPDATKGPKEDAGTKFPKENVAKEPLDDKYKGYEILLDIEDFGDEPDLPPSSDIQGNVRALKHTLNHLLVYRDPAVDLNKVKMVVPQWRRDKTHPPQPPPTYQEKVDNVLSNLKSRKTFEDESLSSVLKDKELMQNKFPEAGHLIGQIQKRYNAVRVHSLKEAKAAREISGNFKQFLPTTTSP